jgi:hypothetical protein
LARVFAHRPSDFVAVFQKKRCAASPAQVELQSQIVHLLLYLLVRPVVRGFAKLWEEGRVALPHRLVDRGHVSEKHVVAVEAELAAATIGEVAVYSYVVIKFFVRFAMIGVILR